MDQQPLKFYFFKRALAGGMFLLLACSSHAFAAEMEMSLSSSEGAVSESQSSGTNVVSQVVCSSNGSTCVNTCQAKVAEGLCGNNILDAGEECDGEINVGEGYVCDQCKLKPVNKVLCPNGNIDSGEQCDDGNSVNDDSCTNTCQSAVCGDAITQPANEQCDDGNTSSGDGCSDTCQLEECGDEKVDVGEECDDGNTEDGDGCSHACIKEMLCGNGIVNAGEECDDGNTQDGDGCSSGCKKEAPKNCTLTCTADSQDDTTYTGQCSLTASEGEISGSISWSGTGSGVCQAPQIDSSGHFTGNQTFPREIDDTCSITITANAVECANKNLKTTVNVLPMEGAPTTFTDMEGDVRNSMEQCQDGEVLQCSKWIADSPTNWICTTGTESSC